MEVSTSITGMGKNSADVVLIRGIERYISKSVIVWVRGLKQVIEKKNILQHESQHVTC